MPGDHFPSSVPSTWNIQPRTAFQMSALLCTAQTEPSAAWDFLPIRFLDPLSDPISLTVPRSSWNWNSPSLQVSQALACWEADSSWWNRLLKASDRRRLPRASHARRPAAAWPRRYSFGWPPAPLAAGRPGSGWLGDREAGQRMGTAFRGSQWGADRSVALPKGAKSHSVSGWESCGFGRTTGATFFKRSYISGGFFFWPVACIKSTIWTHVLLLFLLRKQFFERRKYKNSLRDCQVELRTTLDFGIRM